MNEQGKTSEVNIGNPNFSSNICTQYLMLKLKSMAWCVEALQV